MTLLRLKAKRLLLVIVGGRRRKSDTSQQDPKVPGEFVVVVVDFVKETNPACELQTLERSVTAESVKPGE